MGRGNQVGSPEAMEFPRKYPCRLHEASWFTSPSLSLWVLTMSQKGESLLSSSFHRGGHSAPAPPILPGSTDFRSTALPGGSPMAQWVKNPPATQKTQEMQVRSPGWENPLQKEMATHPSIPAWENPMDRGAWWAAVHGRTKSWNDSATKHTQKLCFDVDSMGPEVAL